MTARSPALTGILCLVTGIAVFSVQDLILKKLSGDYPLHQAMVLRSLTALPFHILIVRAFDGHFGTILTPGWPLMMLRGVLNFCAYTAYYLGLATLPMATTVALFFTMPLFITLSAALFLRERVPPASALAVIAGFTGVLLVVRPSNAGFDLAALLPVLGACGYALCMVMARLMGQTQSAAAMAFWSNIAFLLGALVLSAIYGSGALAQTGHPAMAFLTRGWITPGMKDLALMASCGVIAAIGLTLLTQAYRIAPSATIAPFEYSFMFWGVLWGWLFWSELPDRLGWLGIGVIIAAGLIVIRQPAAASAPSEAAS